MKKSFFNSLFFSFVLTNLSLFVKREVICEGGSFFDINFTPGCAPGKTLYFVRGWPIEFFWSNNIGFELVWYLLDLFFYLMLGMFFFFVLIPTLKKLTFQK